MEDAIRAFVTFLEVERHASPETIRGYRSDLQQLASFLLQSQSPAAPPVDITRVEAEHLRAYLHWLDRKSEKAVTLARKLACLRTFYRFLLREKMALKNP